MDYIGRKMNCLILTEACKLQLWYYLICNKYEEDRLIWLFVLTVAAR